MRPARLPDMAAAEPAHATTMRSADLRRRHNALKTYLLNPVVVRDLRAQMRGTKSYWYQAGFLLLLGTLALLGYAQATGQGFATPADAGSASLNLTDAQARLEIFYRFIFLTLATLTALIAPALTASSVVSERQRLSFDLLVTTPLSAGQLLVGKLISSTAFLVLLLALSLPATALCVLLGGATIGDLLRVYLLLAADGLVLAAIGLYFSSTVRVPLLATIWTYGSVLAYLVITGILYGLSQGARPSADGSLLMALASLNPLVAMAPGAEGGIPAAFGLSLPMWPLTLAAAAVAIRLILTAAEYRLGLYGSGSVRSLRRQTLLALGVIGYVTAHGLGRMVSRETLGNPGYPNEMIASGMTYAFLICLPFLVSLFVPASAEDAPPGAVASQAAGQADGALYRPSRALTADHAGALPFFHQALAVGAAAVLAGVFTRADGFNVSPAVVVSTAAYLAALGFLLWAVAWRCARSVAGLSAARAVTFAVFAGTVALPMMGLGLFAGDWGGHPLSALWLFRPLLRPWGTGAGFEAQAIATALALALGAGFLLSERITARRSRER